MASYDFVINSHFKPFSFQEMLAPYAIYKEAYDKAEEKYYEMKDKANVFKYLSDTLPENSRARQIYEGFANDLENQTKSFLQHGLTIPTKSALTSLRGRIKGEIGLLEQADEKLKAETKVRDALRASGKQVLYANENPTIDDYLPGSKFNDYGIGTDALYNAGFNAAKSASARKFWAGDAGSVMGYYRDWVQKQGFSDADIAKFSDEAREQFKNQFISDALGSMPGLQSSLKGILKSEGVLDNLKGNNLNRAFEATLRGMIDGAVYQEQHTPQRDLGVLTKAEETDKYFRQQGLNLQNKQLNHQIAQDALALKMRGFDENGNYLGVEHDAEYQRAVEKSKAVETEKILAKAAAAKANGVSLSGSSKTPTSRGLQLPSAIRVTWKDDYSNAPTSEVMDEDINPGISTPVGPPCEYKDLNAHEKKYVDTLGIDPSAHIFYHTIDPNLRYKRLNIIPGNVKVVTGLENALQNLVTSIQDGGSSSDNHGDW